MRPVIAGATALAAAFALAGVVAPTASAAEGALIIGNTVHDNPHGCYEVWDERVVNFTDRNAEVFAGPDCEEHRWVTSLEPEDQMNGHGWLSIGIS